MCDANVSDPDFIADQQSELEEPGIDSSFLTAHLFEYLKASTASTPQFPKVLTLDISGHKFKVSRDVLEAGSGLFALQLSDNFTWEPQADGSYFMDADPELFEHLIRFMRRPESYPLFYDQAKGFDYDLYRRLEAEAEYFQINLLTEWIKSEKYLEAVKTITTAVSSRVISDTSLLTMDHAPLSQNRSQEYHFIPRIIKSYVCPRNIVVHMGQKDRCGMACNKARGDLPDAYEEKYYTQVIVVDKQVIFDRAICQVE
ncbi:hypothetical protein Ptr902_05528 [Pyrenophora tritici-repentis]|nr:hypothetical protein Ptr902_05528 [Pyrenophora tritici-repentis]